MTEHEPIEKREAVILEEMRQLEATHGKEAVATRLNNAWLNFLSEEVNNSNRNISRQNGHLNKIPAEYTDSRHQEVLKSFSDIRLNQTDADFFQTLDHTAQSLGILEDLRNVTTRILEGQKPQTTESHQEMARKYKQFDEAKTQSIPLLIKLFARMRAMGYSTYDITGRRDTEK